MRHPGADGYKYGPSLGVTAPEGASLYNSPRSDASANRYIQAAVKTLRFTEKEFTQRRSVDICTKSDWDLHFVLNGLQKG